MFLLYLNYGKNDECKTGALARNRSDHQKSSFRKLMSQVRRHSQKMRTCKILLNTVTDVKEFVSLVSGCTYEIGLVSGRYSVNAKSIMGVFSLDLSKPVTLCAHFDDTDRLFAELRKFKVA